MPEVDIIDFEVGLHVAVRSGYQSWYGRFVAVTPTTATVRLESGEERRFSRSSRFQIGSTESRYTRPYITTVASSRRKDAEHAAAVQRARAFLATKEKERC